MAKTKKGPPHIDFGTGKVRKDLGAARREGRAAAGGQLGTISDRANRGINKQLAAADKRTSRILANMENISRQSGRFGRQQRKGIEAETAHQLSLGGGMSSGLTGSRSRTTNTATKAAATVTSALGKQGEKARAAEMQAIRSGKRSESQQDRASLSILDVLAAERKSEDVKFVQTMQQEEDMANFQADQQIYMAKLQSRLAYKMETKKAEAEGNKGQLYNFGVQMSAIENGIQTATEIMSDPKQLELIRLKLPNTSDADAVTQFVQEKIGNSVPENVEVSAINEAISRTVANGYAGELAPTWDEVSALIGGTSQEMNKYVRSNPRLKNLHNEFKEIRTQYRDVVPGLAEGVALEGAGGEGEVDTEGVSSVQGSTASLALAGVLGTGLVGAALTAAKAGGLAGGPMGVMRAFLSRPGAFQGAVGNALAKAGVANPFKALPAGPTRLMLQAGKSAIPMGEAGFISGSVLANLGLISAAGVVSHKLISDASTQFQFAEAAEDESLQSTFNMMDAFAESIIAGHRDIKDLDQVASSITETGDAGNLWSSAQGWTGPQKEMVANRLSVLKSYIESIKLEQARSNYVSPIRGL